MLAHVDPSKATEINAVNVCKDSMPSNAVPKSSDSCTGDRRCSHYPGLLWIHVSGRSIRQVKIRLTRVVYRANTVIFSRLHVRNAGMPFRAIPSG